MNEIYLVVCEKNMSWKIKQHFYINDETNASHVRANVPRYNKRLCALKCIEFESRYKTVAMSKETGTYIFVIGKSLGIVGRLLSQGHSHRPK